MLMMAIPDMEILVASMFLMYSLDGINVYGSRVMEFEGLALG